MPGKNSVCSLSGQEFLTKFKFLVRNRRIKFRRSFCKSHHICCNWVYFENIFHLHVCFLFIFFYVNLLLELKTTYFFFSLNSFQVLLCRCNKMENRWYNGRQETSARDRRQFEKEQVDKMANKIYFLPFVFQSAL